MASPVTTGSKLGRYEIIKYLTSGGMADLLLARADGLEGFERHVVIKRIRVEREDDQRFIEMFLHEARLAGSLHHHNIVQVYDIGEEDGKPYFAMEYVHGEDLRAVLRRLWERKEQLPLQHLVTIMAAVATALHHAHEQKGPDLKSLGIVHRDVTPANILVGYDGNVKVVDFGIARAAARRTETQAGMLVGKAPYMAPEQCTGGTIDRRCDVFAVGTVLFELATVRRLFKGDNEFVTMSSIVKGTIPKPSSFRADIPPELDEIILRALARDPAARYQNAEQLFNALENLAVSLGLRTSSTSLAAYMKQLFGERPEPWVGEYRAPAIDVDFDGLGNGVVQAPSDAELGAIPRSTMLTRISPIARALETIGTAPQPVAAAGSQPVPKGTQSGFAIPRTKTPVPAPLPARAKPKTVQIPVVTPKRVEVEVEVEDEDELASTAVIGPRAVDRLVAAVEATEVEPPRVPAKPVLAKPVLAKRVEEADESITVSVTDVEPLVPALLELPVEPAGSRGLPSWSKIGRKPDASSGRPVTKADDTPAAVPPPEVPLAKIALAKAPVAPKAEPVKAGPAPTAPAPTAPATGETSAPATVAPVPVKGVRPPKSASTATPPASTALAHGTPALAATPAIPTTTSIAKPAPAAPTSAAEPSDGAPAIAVPASTTAKPTAVTPGLAAPTSAHGTPPGAAERTPTRAATPGPEAPPSERADGTPVVSEVDLAHDTVVGGDIAEDGDTLAQDQTATELVESLADIAPESPAAAPPVIVAPAPPRIADPTSIVKPLPSPRAVAAASSALAEGTKITQPVRAVRDPRTMVLIAGVGAALVGVVVALVIGMSGGDATESPPSETPSAVVGNNAPHAAEPPPPPPPQEPPPTAAIEEPDLPAPAIEEPTAAIEEAAPAPATPVVEPSADEQEPAPVAKPVKKVTMPAAKKRQDATKPVAKKATKKPAPKPTKPQTPPPKPGWDPNALFPKK